MKQEEIKIQGESTRTTIKYFTTFSGQTSDDDLVYYVIADSSNQPIKLVQSSLETKYGLNPINYNIPLSAISSGYVVYTGSVVQNVVNKVIDNNERSYISEDYLGRINYQNNTSNNSNQNNNNVFSFVFFEESPFNDYFLNIKINKSTGVLDTLNIYNVPVNDSPTFSNNTGVLFGKLEALQVLTDENGNKLRIPIRNAVVALFNPSEELPSIGSVDEEGNRVQLNLYENLPTTNGVANIKSYASFQSYLTDYNFSPRDIQNDKIPKKYKYSTVTNEFGEFVLQNIPTGSQTLMVEVDLLKQGLEPEEVALNFFPYPTNDEPNISTVPHLYFNQFPVNIVPSWGDFQTGYTQIDLSIALDLRKWITYFTYPISSRVGNPNNLSNQNTNQAPKVLEELAGLGIRNAFTVLIRDMTQPFIIDAPPKIEIVKIIDIYDRNLDLNCAWNEEFKTRGNKVEFNTTNYNAFKLPSNLYDFNGTDTNGNKGVWLGAYQIKTSFPDQSISFQATGYAEEWPTDTEGTSKYFKANHYDLNRYNGWADDPTKDSPLPGAGVGIFPYEKPWSLSYPEPYKITKRPSVPNPLKSWNQDGSPKQSVDIVNRNGQTNTITISSGDHYLQPRFLDGDLAGGPDAWATNANGFGLQIYSEVYGGNNFSREVTKNEVWRYESVDHWTEQWSNGYAEGLTQLDTNKYPNTPSGKPEIVGERWQRLEAGYAYWLKPRGFPRIKNEPWGDHLLENDYYPFADHNYNSIWQSPNDYNSYYPSIYSYLDEVTLQVGNRANFFSKFGRLNIYRVEKPYYLNPKKPPFTEKFAKFDFQNILVDQSKPKADYGDKERAKKICYTAQGIYGGSRCTNSGYGDTADSFIWLKDGDPNGDPSNDHLQECNVVFCNIDKAGQAFKVRIVNIGTTKVSVNGQELIPGNWNNGKEFRLFNSADILLPANDKYSPKDNCYNGASYLFYIESITTPRGYTVNGTMIQPIYKYQVGVEGEEKIYHLTSMIPRQVGLGNSKCKAVQDYNTPAGFSLNIGGIFNLAIAGLLVWAFPVTAFLVVVVLPKEIRQEITTVMRNFFSSDQYKWNSDYRQNQNLGVYINGYTFCINSFSYMNAYFNNRMGKRLLPYVGDETAESAKADFTVNVPYQGAGWYNDFKNKMSQQLPMAVFQPRTLYLNNLKGADNIGYYCEAYFEIGSDKILFDYAKAF